jgi:hypothetical protein
VLCPRAQRLPRHASAIVSGPACGRRVDHGHGERPALPIHIATASALASATSGCPCTWRVSRSSCASEWWAALARGPTDAVSASRRRSASGEELPTGGDHRFGPLTHGLDNLGVVDPAEVARGDRKVRMPELALDHEQRDPLA